MPRHTRLQAAVVRDGHVLLLRCRPDDGTEFWIIPGGGRLDDAEPDERAVEREVGEEAGLAVRAGRLLADTPADPPDGTYQRWRTYECTVAATGAQPAVIADADTGATLLGVRWLPLADRATWDAEIVDDAFIYPQLLRIRAATGHSEPGIVREATADDAEAIGAVQVLAWRDTYRGIVDGAYIDALSVEGRAARWRDALAGPAPERPAVFVATDDTGVVVGFVSGGRSREPTPGFDAELWAIYIMTPFHGRGVGRRLTRALAAALGARGHRAMEVRVLSDNLPARRFYEALGGRPLREGTVTFGGREYAETRYGWDDLAALAT